MIYLHFLSKTHGKILMLKNISLLELTVIIWVMIIIPWGACGAVWNRKTVILSFREHLNGVFCTLVTSKASLSTGTCNSEREKKWANWTVKYWTNNYAKL